MPKRITLLRRRSSLTPAEYSLHWSTVHAEIAKGLPRVERYLQNHVEEPDGLDGIVELWFADDAAAAAGFGSDVADRLIADEPEFLDALTGCAFRGEGPHGPWPLKVWILVDEAVDAAALAPRLDAVPGAIGARVDVIDVGAPMLVRAALQRLELPQTAISVGFDASDSAAAFAADAARTLDGLPIRSVHRARELVII